jgi:hypothetical protein
MYRSLNATFILQTIQRLADRVSTRFPGSGLSLVASELHAVSEVSARAAAQMSRPIYALRAGVLILIAGMVVLAVAPFFVFNMSTGVSGFGELIQVLEAAVNDLVFLALGIFFLATLEGRIKRRRALRRLRELRSIAHIVDMHQLTKDPEILMSVSDGASVEGRLMSREDLAKYLDYASEMLSLTSKVSALYIQNMDDSVVLNTVNEIEALTSGLSRKIWQKIMILDTVGVTAAPPRPSPES